MAISDKTRKILWGRPGNRCAICKLELVVDATGIDDESVVGDECHIMSSLSSGPRHDPSFPRDKLDTYENLILLCRVHHKMVDDQYESYAVAILRQMKVNHEVWVSNQLSDTQNSKPLKFRRIKKNIPAYLIRLTTGTEVLNLILNSYAFLTGHDELKSQEEVDLIGNFLQTIQDLGDIGNSLEAGDRVKTAYDLARSLEELDNSGFFVFGGREIQLLESGTMAEPENWPVAILQVLRKDNDAITYVNPNNVGKDCGQPDSGKK